MSSVQPTTGSAPHIAQRPVNPLPVDPNSLSPTAIEALNRSRAWVTSGKLELRFKGIDGQGQPVYEARATGSKKTVLIRANSFVDAAVQAVKLMKDGRLVGRAAPSENGSPTKAPLASATSWSASRTDVRFKLPEKPSFSGTSPEPRQDPSKNKAPADEGAAPLPSVLPALSRKPSSDLAPQTRNPNPFVLGYGQTLKPIDPVANLGKGLLPSSTPSRSESKLTIDGAQVVVLRTSDASKPVQALLPDGEVLKFNAGTTDQGIQKSRIVRDKLQRLEARPAEGKDDATATTYRKAFVYSLSGAVTSYNVLRSQGYTQAAAVALLPAGAGRDVIQVVLADSKSDQKNPYLEVIEKGAKGGLLVFGSNAVAGAVHRPAWPKADMHVSQIAAAFTVNGFIVAQRELLKAAGHAPKDKTKGIAEWLEKVLPEAIAVGLGVSVTQGVRTSIEAVRGGAGALSPTARQTYLKAFLYPALQYVIASYLTDGPNMSIGEQKQLNDLQKSLGGVGGYVATDKLTAMLNKNPGNKFNLAQSARWALGFAALGQIVEIYNDAKSLDQLDIRKPDSAKLALEKINELLEVPAIHMESKVFGGGTYVQQLERERQEIYKQHPTLRTSQRTRIKI
jgi:hypothetical protein